MRITIIFTPLFSEQVQTEECTVNVENGTCVRQLLDILINKFGQDFRGIIPSSNDPPGILVVRNHHVVRNLDEELADGDLIDFIVPPSGG
jgi:molybdopterin converting factor small subunit